MRLILEKSSKLCPRLMVEIGNPPSCLDSCLLENVRSSGLFLWLFIIGVCKICCFPGENQRQIDKKMGQFPVQTGSVSRLDPNWTDQYAWITNSSPLAQSNLSDNMSNGHCPCLFGQLQYTLRLSKLPWTMSDTVKYRAALWSFLKFTALVFYHVWHSPWKNVVT